MTNRINRINEEIKRELSTLLRELKDPRLKDKLISVTNVEVSGDLRYAKVFVSVMTDGDDVIDALKAAAGYIRREIAQRVKLRQSPQFLFELDSSIAHGAHINQILKEVLGTDANSGEGGENEQKSD